MKKILLISLLLFPLAVFAADLANSPAIEPTLAEQALQYLLMGLSVLIGFLIKNALPLLSAWLKQVMHFRGADVVTDAIVQALTRTGEATRKALADGIITDAEMKAIKAEAKQIAEDKLRRLSGFYKKDLSKWIDEQVEIGLGKLFLRVFGKKKDSETLS